ncbi:unnamed protein product [Rotaria socialis]|uniref:Transducer of regulated CREB activity N-terminal domain-containing protein n=1 Tax=Rotaria socialis TaxID=392032 RepID=A0A818HSL4_9BILA|nr:unnamed protein product [Rotaria socialis]CAF3411345.1 unnamed protein product [Rotaria socialis]CAF3513040.1 unnamed protein product [Rotaria socialis]
MSSPRKFAEKIALIQQKQAEGDAAFNTIIYEVEAAKQRADRISSTNSKLDVPTRKYDKPFEIYQESNGMNNSDNHNTNNYEPQQIKMDSSNDSDRLLQLPDNSSWRRTHSDSSLHHTMMPSVAAHYHARMDNDNNGQPSNYDMNDIKYDSSSYSSHQHLPPHFQISNSPFQQHQHFDFNHNLNYNYMNGRSNVAYPLPQIPTPIAPTTSLPTQPAPSSPSPHTHTLLGPRYSGGSNVLMLPPNHHPRGGSLPDLRTENAFHHQQVSFSTTPSPPTTTAQHFFRSSSLQQNGDVDLYALGPQQQLPSNIGPLKQSPSIRRRHSPIGEVKQSSPRRQNSPSPDVSSNQQTLYRVEPSSPQSQSSYSPQNSPHLLPSPGNDHSPFSPQQSTDNNTNNQQPYFTLPTHFDQITLDNNFYPQQSSPSPSSSTNQNSNHPSSSTSILTSLSNDVNGMHLNYFRPQNFYPTFINDTSSSYCQNQSTVSVTASVTQKSPTIPNIILTDVDSSKLDLSKELANDFTHAFDSLIGPNDLQLNADDFLLNVHDLSMDPHICDDSFRMEN